MGHRVLILLLAGLLLGAGGLGATAHAAGSPPYRLGYLEGRTRWHYADELRALRAGLARLGLAGQIEFPPDAQVRQGQNSRSIDPSIVAGELVPVRQAAELMRRSDLHLVIAMGTEAGIALQMASNGTTPIVGVGIADPVSAGLVRDAKTATVPNFTTAVVPDRWVNMLRTFHTVIRFHRLGILYRDTPALRASINLEDAREVAREKGFELLEDGRLSDDASVDDCLKGLRRLAERRMDAFYISGLRCFDWSLADSRPLYDYLNRRRVATFARDGTPDVDLGALMGASRLEAERFGDFHAGQIAAILRGARPSSVPMLLPLTLGMSLNLQTARAIRLDFPMDVLVSADVIVVTTDSLEEVRRNYGKPGDRWPPAGRPEGVP
jgi:ABC-type uncharacterized transport system substrate-binding protein